MSIYSDIFKVPHKDKVRYSIVTEGEEESGIDWLVQFDLNTSELDDEFDSNYREEIVISAKDFDTAHKYAQQYIRTMRMKSETKDSWKDAKITSIDKQS